MIYMLLFYLDHLFDPRYKNYYFDSYLDLILDSYSKTINDTFLLLSVNYLKCIVVHNN